jgi:penicillin-binding protein 1A
LQLPSNIALQLNRYLRSQKKLYRWIVRGIWTFTLCLLIGVPLFIGGVIYNPWNLFGPLPSLREIENPDNDLSSEIISADGVSLGRIFTYNRSPVSYEDLSPDLVKTLLISEDHRFRQHSGMDFEAFLRVAKGLLTFSRQGGGSTLTQQTAKNLFRTREEELTGKLGQLSSLFGIVISKTKEWVIAVRLEANFTKDEIIALYLNTVPFNNSAYGIRVGSETYFQKSPFDLNLVESALLVGMLRGTSIYNPVRFPDRAKNKRNEVIQKLVFHKFISTAVGDSLKALPLGLNFKVQDHNEGLATYFRSMVQKELKTWCKDHGYNLSESGLKIYTTIDSRLQTSAERAVTNHMATLQRMFEKDWSGRNPWVDENGIELKDFVTRKLKRSDEYKRLKSHFNNDDSVNFYLNKKRVMSVFSHKGKRDTVFNFYDSIKYYNRFLQAGLLSIEPETGAVKAWVGGINHRYFKFDHVKQSSRQPGSTFKPILYGVAIENGYSPCQQFIDTSPELMINGKPYHVKNADGTFGDGQSYTLRRALAKSLNSISVQLIDKLKPENVTEFAERVGITSKLDPVYSLALGTSDVTLIEITGAYTTFVNQGIHTKPHYLLRIEDKHGNVIQTFQPESRQSLDENTAYTMVHMLRGGVEEEGGSSRALSEFVKSDNEIGGKTGTTDNGSDGWFIGVTPNLVTGVWVGGDERSIHFPRWGASSGGRTALPIFDHYMTDVYNNPSYGYRKTKFKIPDTFNPESLNCDRYATPSDSTSFTF